MPIPEQIREFEPQGEKFKAWMYHNPDFTPDPFSYAFEADQGKFGYNLAKIRPEHKASVLQITKDPSKTGQHEARQFKLLNEYGRICLGIQFSMMPKRNSPGSKILIKGEIRDTASVLKHRIHQDIDCLSIVDGKVRHVCLKYSSNQGGGQGDQFTEVCQYAEDCSPRGDTNLEGIILLGGDTFTPKLRKELQLYTKDKNCRVWSEELMRYYINHVSIQRHQ